MTASEVGRSLGMCFADAGMDRPETSTGSGISWHRSPEAGGDRHDSTAAERRLDGFGTGSARCPAAPHGQPDGSGSRGIEAASTARLRMREKPHFEPFRRGSSQPAPDRSAPARHAEAGYPSWFDARPVIASAATWGSPRRTTQRRRACAAALAKTVLPDPWGGRNRGQSIPSLAFSRAFTAAGFALPPVAFIVWPTNQPSSVGFSLAWATLSGLAAMI